MAPAKAAKTAKDSSSSQPAPTKAAKAAKTPRALRSSPRIAAQAEEAGGAPSARVGGFEPRAQDSARHRRV